MKDKNENFGRDDATDLNENFIKDGAKGITSDDLKKVVDKMKDIEDKIFHNNAFKKFRDEASLLFNLVKDYASRSYTEISWVVIAAVVFALLYVLSPIDVIPDFIPIAGYLDDASVLAACVRLIKNELDLYKVWKKLQ